MLSPLHSSQCFSQPVAGAKRGSGQALFRKRFLMLRSGLAMRSDVLISKVGLDAMSQEWSQGSCHGFVRTPIRLSLITAAAAALATMLLVSPVKPTMGQAYTIPGLSDLPALPGLASGLINSVTTGASCGRS